MSETFGKISIIMAAYNAENTVEEAVHSVQAQTFTNWELLIVNDCSTDNTLEIVDRLAKEDERIRVIMNPRNSGVSFTRKNGLEHAEGEWIAVLDSDDKWAAEKLEKEIQLQKETGAQLLYTGSAFMTNEGERMEWEMHVPTKVTYRQLLKQNIISNSSSLVLKDLYSKYYSSGDGMHEDFAMWLRILKSGVVAYGVDEPLLIYRLSKNAKTSNKLKAAKMNWNTYRYLGMNVFEAAYYMCFYMINGVLKYRKLK